MKIISLVIAMTFIGFSPAAAFKLPWGVDTNSKKAEKLYREALSAYGSASYDKVIDLTTQAVSVDAKFAKGYALRGKAKKSMGDVDGAMADLSKAIELDPKLGEAWFVRAQVNEIMGRMKKASADYSKGCAAGYRDACL